MNASETLELMLKPIWGADDIRRYTGWGETTYFKKMNEWFREDPTARVEPTSLKCTRDRFLEHFLHTTAVHEAEIAETICGPKEAVYVEPRC